MPTEKHIPARQPWPELYKTSGAVHWIQMQRGSDDDVMKGHAKGEMIMMLMRIHVRQVDTYAFACSATWVTTTTCPCSFFSTFDVCWHFKNPIFDDNFLYAVLGVLYFSEPHILNYDKLQEANTHLALISLISSRFVVGNCFHNNFKSTAYFCKTVQKHRKRRINNSRAEILNVSVPPLQHATTFACRQESLKRSN